MVFFGVLVILAIAYAIRFLDNKSEEKSRREVEVVHKKMYDLIDEHFGSAPEIAREYKADADAYICGVWKELGRDYNPASVDQVTTAKERRERVKAEVDGCGDIYRANKRNKAMLMDAADNARLEMFADSVMSDPDFAPVTLDDGKLRLANTLMDSLGIGRDEALRRVEHICNQLNLA